MRMKDKRKRKLSEKDIDDVVVAQADDDSAWEKPIRVRRRSTSLSIPAALAARASFLASLHRQASIEDWLTRIIQERVEIEEAAFAGVKRDMTNKNGIS